MVQQKTFLEHRKLYYNVERSEWIPSKDNSPDILSTSEPDSDYSRDMVSEPSSPSLPVSPAESFLALDTPRNIDSSSDDCDTNDLLHEGVPLLRTAPLDESSSGEEDWDESDMESAPSSHTVPEC